MRNSSKVESAAKVFRGIVWLSGIPASNNRAAIFRMPLKTAQPMATQMAILVQLSLDARAGAAVMRAGAKQVNERR
jgi:hypothetical protein